MRLAVASWFDDALFSQAVEAPVSAGSCRHRRGECRTTPHGVKVELGDEADLSHNTSVTARSSCPRRHLTLCADYETRPSTNRGGGLHTPWGRPAQCLPPNIPLVDLSCTCRRHSRIGGAVLPLSAVTTA